MSDSLNINLGVPAELNSEGITVRLAGTPETPLFCLSDVCRLLDIGNPSDVSRWLDQDDLDQGEVIDSMGRKQSATFVTEAGLYTVLLRTDKPLAKSFRKWVCGEALPSIRKHGSYPPPARDLDPLLILLRQNQAELHVVERLYLTQQEQGERLAQVERTADAALEVARDNHGHYAVLGYARLHGWQMPVSEAARHGKHLTAICAGLGVEIGRVRDPRFGFVNTYPESVLDDYFANHGPGAKA
jgi:prophage antirepressor-like protein